MQAQKAVLLAAMLLCASLHPTTSQPPEEDAGPNSDDYCEGPSEDCGRPDDIPITNILCNVERPDCFPKTQEERAIIDMVTSLADWRSHFKTREEIRELQLRVFAAGKPDGGLCCETDNYFHSVCGQQISSDQKPHHVLCFPDREDGSTVVYYQYANVGTCGKTNHCSSSQLQGKCRSMPKYVSLFSVALQAPWDQAFRLFNVSGYCSCQSRN